MADVVDKQTRSRMMSRIRGKDTAPELRLRKALHSEGYRYVLHDRRLPGTPDIVLPKWQAVIEVRGCFWHRHQGCRYATTPATRPEFWNGKFAGNVDRDRKNIARLQKLGWRTAIVWECELKKGDLESFLRQLTNWIESVETTF